jgi:DNA-binding NtrC family response regulator
MSDPAQESVLVLDQDQNDLEACGRQLSSLGYRPLMADALEDALRLLNSENPALLLADIVSLAEWGSKVWRSVHNGARQTPVVLLIRMADIDAAVAAVKEGASFYLLKPVSLDHLRAALERAMPSRRRDCLEHEREPQPHSASGEIIVGASNAIRKVLDVTGRVAQSDANIVLFGESGTGKELFARTIHTCSNRAGGPFIPVDCASLPENLLEGELFGFERGAFTGAVHSKPGLMELAHLGTLFFDELELLPKVVDLMRA